MDLSANAPSNVKDGTDQSFMEDVIETSQETPVLVDFWAPWCGPCKTLGPVIERAVDAKGGKVKLVKVNIDENPGIAGQLGVRSIPAVFGFDKGRPVDGFMGAVPESQINEFIEKLLSGTDTGKQLEEALDQAVQLFQSGDVGGAAQIYAAVIREDETNVPAIAGLARCYLANDDAERAQQTLDMVPDEHKSHPDVKGVVMALELTAGSNEPDETGELRSKLEANSGDHQTRFELAEALIAQGKAGDAVDEIFTIMEKDREWNDGAAKELLFKLFEAEGPKAEITKKGRRRLSALLFS